MPPSWTGRRVNLEFDGVFQVAEVFVNGQRVGTHQGGYTGFTCDITDAVKPGDNLVAVRVNNTSRWTITRRRWDSVGSSSRRIGLLPERRASLFQRRERASTNAWLRVDLERIVTVSQTKLTFPPKGNWHYHVEISDDGDNGWKSLGESEIREEGIVDTIKLVKGMTGRFLRVRFVGEPDATLAALAELEVRGSLSLQ